MKLSHVGTILFGSLLIAVIAPLSQFLAMKAVHMEIETSSPIGWAVGTIFALVIGLAVVRLVSRSRQLSRPNVVLLYSMLTIAAPVMNVGLVRHVMNQLWVVNNEYVAAGTSTYRLAWEVRDNAWFPKVPSDEALAWHKVDRLLRELWDAKIDSVGGKARETIIREIQADQSLLRRFNVEQQKSGNAGANSTAPPADAQAVEKVQAAIDKLGVDEVNKLLTQMQQEAFAKSARRLGLTEDKLQARFEMADAKAKAAMDRLKMVLPWMDEEVISQTQAKMDRMSYADPSGYERVMQDRKRYGHEDDKGVWQPDPAYDLLIEKIKIVDMPVKELLAGQIRTGEEEWLSDLNDWLSGLTTAVSEAYGEGEVNKSLYQLLSRDYSTLNADRRVELTTYLTDDPEAGLNAKYENLSPAELDAIRHSMVFRMSRDERRQLMQDATKPGQPDENIWGYFVSVWPDSEAKAAFDRMTYRERFDAIIQTIPWNVWTSPLLLWGLLFILLFLFLMALAEWFRRKWIERENLAFPLVEIVDYMIRHDARLETAEDVTNPPARKGLVNMTLVMGMVLGFVWIGAEAVWHYQLIDIGTQPTVAFNVSGKIFTEGVLKNLSTVFIVLSPIIIGIAFLISLEISFSVWVMFIIWQIAILLIRMGGSVPRGSNETGWGGGKNFPFAMEQMLGAALCFSIFILYKMWQSGSGKNEKLGSYLPRPVLWIFTIGAPLGAIFMVYQYGVDNIWFMLLMALFWFALIIAAARARAETGLHTQHSSYEFTKLPMIFGITGWTGSRVYVLFTGLVFLPLSMLGRLLPQQLENLELSRRHGLKYSVLATGQLSAFVVAISVGMLSFLLMSYLYGGDFLGFSAFEGTAFYGQAAYPTWVSHFKGAPGLDDFTHPMWPRIIAIGAGFAVLGALIVLRMFFLSFPIHPLGFFLVLTSIYWGWIDTSVKTDSMIGSEGSLIWAGVFVAWLLKKLLIKYGGMNTYKQAKPFFAGMVLGAILCVFAFNMVDLAASLAAENMKEPTAFMKLFVDKAAYSPRLY